MELHKIPNSMRCLVPFLAIFSILLCKVYGVPPVLNYAGQVAVNGEAFDGNGLFKFALVNADGNTTYWSNDGTSVDGSEPQASVAVPVRGGLYSILLGNTAQQGMGAIDPSVFAQHNDAKLRVWFSDGVNGFQQLSPDRPFASVPYAFSAGNAETAASAAIANGAVTKSMLSSEVINDLDRKITMNDLDPAVIADLNDSVTDGSIGLSKLSSEVSNALKPAVLSQPTSVISVNGGSTSLSVNATGGDNNYQWKKNGVEIAGATDSTLSITDINASQHEGNYTVVVSNAFGSVTSSVAQIDVNGSLTEGLVGWWKFDGDANDTSGNDNHGVVNGAALATDRFGNVDSAYLFDGTSPYILISNDFGSTVTISIWISKYNDIGEMVWCFGNQGTGPDLLVTENKISLNTWDSNTNSFGNFVHESNKWYNFVTIISSDNTKQYVNGDLLGAASYRSPAGKDFYISMKESGQGDYAWTGLLDDVRIYDRALSAFEVKTLYELGEKPVQGSDSGTTTVVNGTVADGSITASKIADQTITTNQLSEQILKYLKPEITAQPQAQTVYADTNATFSVTAEGKYLTYQWKKDGVDLTGETNATLTITDANATLHDGNYSVVVSNDFGSVESDETEVVELGF